MSRFNQMDCVARAGLALIAAATVGMGSILKQEDAVAVADR